MDESSEAPSVDRQDRAEQLAALERARGRTLERLQVACNRLQRAELERILAELDEQLARCRRVRPSGAGSDAGGVTDH